MQHRSWCERQLTFAPVNHILTNVGCWSPDSQWIVYDLRSDLHGTVFDGPRIERVHVHSGAVETVFTARNGGCVGVVTHSPTDDRVVFIEGPEHPDDTWQYSATHRRGVVVQTSQPELGMTLDARDLVYPFTPGALRGGTHVHTFSGDGRFVSSTYQDAVLEQLDHSGHSPPHDSDQRNVAVSADGLGPVMVRHHHLRNHDGSHWTVLATRTVEAPAAGSDQISRAFSDAWVGTNGYRQIDGTWQRRAIAFQGHVVTTSGETIAEAYIVDLPDDPNELAKVGDGPLEGTPTQRPAPPAKIHQRRLTFTAEHPFAGLDGPRHWLRSSPDGKRIALLKRDQAGIVQLWTVSPWATDLMQMSNNAHDIASAFSWSPDGNWIAHVMDRSVCVTDTGTGKTERISESAPTGFEPSPLACVFSPDGQSIAYLRPVPGENGSPRNQIFLLSRRSADATDHTA